MCRPGAATSTKSNTSADTTADKQGKKSSSPLKKRSVGICFALIKGYSYTVPIAIPITIISVILCRGKRNRPLSQGLHLHAVRLSLQSSIFFFPEKCVHSRIQPSYNSPSACKFTEYFVFKPRYSISRAFCIQLVKTYSQVWRSCDGTD